MLYLMFIVVGIIFLETVALLKEVDGTMFGASMVALGALAGWIVKHYTIKLKKKKG